MSKHKVTILEQWGQVILFVLGLALACVTSVIAYHFPILGGVGVFLFVFCVTTTVTLLI